MWFHQPKMSIIPKKAATSVTAYIHPKDTCVIYFLSQGIAGRDLRSSESPS